jgi:2Fe-2S ferredoxin
VIQVNVIDANGDKESISVKEGITLMEALRYQGKKAYVSADCGACCACGTCHVYLNKDWFDKLDKMMYNSAEYELLEYQSNFVEDRSRLSCQVVLKKEYDGIEVIIPNE